MTAHKTKVCSERINFMFLINSITSSYLKTEVGVTPITVSGECKCNYFNYERLRCIFFCFYFSCLSWLRLKITDFLVVFRMVCLYNFVCSETLAVLCTICSNNLCNFRRYYLLSHYIIQLFIFILLLFLILYSLKPISHDSY